MNHRERFLRTMKFQTVDRVPDYEFGAWEQTIQRWHNEGLPKEYDGVWSAINGYFKTDTCFEIYINTGLNPNFSPQSKYSILEEKGDHLVILDEDGATCEMMKPELGASIPRYLRHAIKTRQDWEKIKAERLDLTTPGRLPKTIDQLCKSSWSSEDPVVVRIGSLYGWLRNWMGVENLSYAICDEPEWIEEMMEHLTVLCLSVLEKVAGTIKIDVANIWEDMCFRTGPLLSPRHFGQWMVPRYKRITDFLKNECNCEFTMVDCDGNIHQLAPLWLNGGVNVMFPLEVAHTDAYQLSKEFGSKMALRGGFDKIALINGKDAIDKEFERISPLFKKGGFIPHTDHLVPPDVSFEDYLYYRKKKCELISRKDL